MAKCSQMAFVAWIMVAGLVVVPSVVVAAAIILVGRPGLSVLAVALVLYISALLVWLVLKCRQGKIDQEQGEVPAPEQDLSGVTTTKTPSCILTMPTVAAVPPSDDLNPPPYDLVQALSHAPDGEALVRETCQQVFGETCRADCPRCGTQAASPIDDSALPTYSELVTSGAIPSSDSIMAPEEYEKCFSGGALASVQYLSVEVSSLSDSLHVSTLRMVDQFT